MSNVVLKDWFRTVGVLVEFSNDLEKLDPTDLKNREKIRTLVNKLDPLVGDAAAKSVLLLKEIRKGSLLLEEKPLIHRLN